jgi:hypothetical protein
VSSTGYRREGDQKKRLQSHSLTWRVAASSREFIRADRFRSILSRCSSVRPEKSAVAGRVQWCMDTMAAPRPGDDRPTPPRVSTMLAPTPPLSLSLPIESVEAIGESSECPVWGCPAVSRDVQIAERKEPFEQSTKRQAHIIIVKSCTNHSDSGSGLSPGVGRLKTELLRECSPRR